MSDTLVYEPSEQFDNTNGLYGNHFKFAIEALPDLTFFAQTIQLPSVIVGSLSRPNPFTKIKEVGDHLEYGSFDVNYLIDQSFKTYTSLLWWIQGYGFPHSYDEVKAFRETRTSRLAYPRPSVRQMEKTTATLYILHPETDAALFEIQFQDVFPTALGSIDFSTTDSDAPQLRTTVTFQCTTFDVVPAVS